MEENELLAKVKELSDRAFKLMASKNSDYATGMDPYQNFKLVETLGITDLKRGIAVRMCDKLARISHLLNKEASVKDESIVDSLIDLANYSFILASLY